MKKIIFLFLFSINIGFCYADDFDRWGVARDTVIATTGIDQSVFLSSGVVYLSYYQVLSTAALTANFNIYDGSVSSTTAIKSYTEYPLTNYFDNFNLGIMCSSGTYFVMHTSTINATSGNPKIRLKYFKLNGGI